MIKKVKIPKIEIKLINPACHFEDEIEEASHATPEATSAPQGSHKQQIHSPSATKPARRPKLPPPSTHKVKFSSHLQTYLTGVSINPLCCVSSRGTNLTVR
ncbi:hypothetical protein EON65_24480 [archaeon]|nr:MAG: hypothetical protein EON65_24480 [archaeon]